MLKTDCLPMRVGLAAALMIALVPATASAAECPPVPTTQPFIEQGDHNSYFLADGGDFEGELRWTTSGSAGVEPSSNPADPTGIQAAKVKDEGSITSAPMCVDNSHPHLRFGALARGSTGTLRVDAFAEGVTGKVSLGRLGGGSFGSWATTPMVPLASLLDIPAGESRQVRLRIAAASGEWLVDGVYIDPYLRG